MTYAQNVGLYFILLTGIIAVPGMDMLFVVANSLDGGRRRGLLATSGIMLGGVCHTIFGAAGVSALLIAVPKLLNGILLVGAAYMIWIGFTLLRSSIRIDGLAGISVRSDFGAFRQGLVTCLLNPKAYLFVVAVYPQFIRAEFGPVWPQALMMGTLTLLMQFLVYGGLGEAAAKSREVLTSHPVVTIWAGRCAGLLFIVVAGATLWSTFLS